jgi:hypothetical protein
MCYLSHSHQPWKNMLPTKQKLISQDPRPDRFRGRQTPIQLCPSRNLHQYVHHLFPGFGRIDLGEMAGRVIRLVYIHICYSHYHPYRLLSHPRKDSLVSQLLLISPFRTQ